MSNNPLNLLQQGLRPNDLAVSTGDDRSRAGSALSNTSSGNAANLLPLAMTVVIGFLVGINYTLAKFAGQRGGTPISLYFWQLLVAAIVLLAVSLVQRRKLVLTARYVTYYLVGGIVGGIAPGLIAYSVLQHVPAGVFTVLITLSPIFTFVFASLVEHRLLPLHRLVGVLLGFSGVGLATISGFSVSGVALSWVLLAGVTPMLLAANNIFRNKAYPPGADPLSLALGTLLVQVLLLWPVMMANGGLHAPLIQHSAIDFIVIAMGLISAISVVLTLQLQKITDGLGTSQIGYFITLTGVLSGALFFGETVGAIFAVAVGLSFLGVALTSGQLSPQLLPFRRRRRLALEPASSNQYKEKQT